MTKITICGNEVEIRHAVVEDINQIKWLFDQNKNELGFVIKSALINSIKRNELIIAVTEIGELIGVVHYRHRKDGQTTLYNIVVSTAYRRKSIGIALLYEMTNEAVSRAQKRIQLKCPIELEANKFYESRGFSLITTEVGKYRPLNIWSLRLQE